MSMRGASTRGVLWGPRVAAYSAVYGASPESDIADAPARAVSSFGESGRPASAGDETTDLGSTAACRGHSGMAFTYSRISPVWTIAASAQASDRRKNQRKAATRGREAGCSRAKRQG